MIYEDGLDFLLQTLEAQNVLDPKLKGWVLEYQDIRRKIENYLDLNYFD